MALRRRRAPRAQAPPGRDRYSATAGLHFDDAELESRLVWIWTMARSGSTWFLKMLSHPIRLVDSGQDPNDMLGFAPPPTWQGTIDAIPVDTTFLANHLLPLPGNTHYLEDGSPVTFGSALGLGQKANYFFSDKYSDSWLPELRRMALVRFHRLIEHTAEHYDTGDPLLLLKEVAGAHAAPLVMRMFPRSKMIFLIRDGRDVVDSQTAANGPGGWLPVSGWSTSEDRLEFVRQRALDWVGDVGSIESAYSAHPAELRRMVRYEDLLTDGTATLGPLVEWLGLNRNEIWLERSIEKNAFSAISAERKGEDKFFRSATPGAWRRNLTTAEAAVLEETVSSKLAALGYDIDPEPGRVKTPGGDSEAVSTPSSLSSATLESNVLSKTLRNRAEGRDLVGVSKLVTRRGGRISRRDRKLALTFDDGPVLQSYEVLQTLESRGAKGTFFLVGRKVAGHEQLVRRIVAGGHEIGNHSYGHAPYPAAQDVRANSAVLTHVAGLRPTLFRPPFGVVDRPGAEAVLDDGMKVILWNADSEDGTPPWQGIPAERIVSNVLRRITPGGIVLLHDGLSWSRAVEALPTLIDRIQEQGYELVTVSELLAEDDEAATRWSLRGWPLRRLRGRGAGSAAAATPEVTPAHPDRPKILGWLAEGVEAPSGDGLAEGLIAGACDCLAGERIVASELFAQLTAAEENDAVRMIAIGYALRAHESRRGGASIVGDGDAARMRCGSDPIVEAAAVARELAAPTRVDRLVMGRMAERAVSDLGADQVDAERFGATERLLALFAPGPEIWEQVRSWACAVGRDVARERMSQLLEAAGVQEAAFEIEEVIDRLDADYLFRLGYALGACEESLPSAHA